MKWFLQGRSQTFQNEGVLRDAQGELTGNQKHGSLWTVYEVSFYAGVELQWARFLIENS